VDEQVFVRDLDGPLAGRRILVFGTGPLGLFTAFALAANGASVEIAAQDPIDSGTGFRHAAGLLEPVATSDPRAGTWFRAGVEFAAAGVEDPKWGITPRRVLFLSDAPALIRQEWMEMVPTRPASEQDLSARRAHGIWFDSYVIQPDIALAAIRREFKLLSIQARAADQMKLDSVERAIAMTSRRNMDAFVLALGLGIAQLSDIEDVVGPSAGLSAGIGLTVRMPASQVDLDHVIMDADELGYLIPQRDTIIGGGTNVVVPFDDELLGGKADKEMVDEWEREVRGKIARLYPPLEGFAGGEVRVGARPLRHQVLTVSVSAEVPGVLVGGAGGSGWTFAVGIANDACAFLCEHLGGVGAPKPLTPVSHRLR
jgi:glycine/D-amino acid oxidase-like deaminating enzyme